MVRFFLEAIQKSLQEICTSKCPSILIPFSMYVLFKHLVLCNLYDFQILAFLAGVGIFCVLIATVIYLTSFTLRVIYISHVALYVHLITTF